MSAPWAGAVAVAEGALCYLGALADADTHAILGATILGVEGDEEKGALGAKDITAAIAEYLAKHPG